MLKKSIGKVLKIRMKKKQLVMLFKENRQFMESGTYLFDNSSSYIYLDDVQVKKKSQELFSKIISVVDFSNQKNIKKMLFYIIQNFFFSNRTIRHTFLDKGKFSGQVFLPERNLQGFKIFDIKQGLVLTKVSSKNKYMKLIHTYDHFKDYFDIPETEFLGDNIIVEKMIDYKSAKCWSHQDYKVVMNRLFENYQSYFSSIKNSCSFKIEYFSVKDYYNKKIGKNSFFDIDFLYNNCDQEIINMPYPFINQHGDLWSSNLLLEKNEGSKLYVIDWEHSSEVVFFYDMFFLFWNEIQLSKSYLLFDHFIEGRYDKYFSSLFELFGYNYNFEKKIDYFIAFLIVHFCSQLEIEKADTQKYFIDSYKKWISYVECKELNNNYYGGANI